MGGENGRGLVLQDLMVGGAAGTWWDRRHSRKKSAEGTTPPQTGCSHPNTILGEIIRASPLSSGLSGGSILATRQYGLGQPSFSICNIVIVASRPRSVAVSNLPALKSCPNQLRKSFRSSLFLVRVGS